MSDADRLLLQRTAEAQSQIARAARLGHLNGSGYVLFGGLSLLFVAFSWDAIGLAIGIILLGVGLHERKQAERLRRGEPSAPRLLMWGELALLGTIIVYAAIGLAFPPDAAAVQQQMKSLGGSASALGLSAKDIERLAKTVSTAWYGCVIAIGLLYQGGMAMYFAKRGALVERYHQDFPAWAREVVGSMSR